MINMAIFMKIALCGYLGSGCTEVAEILASKFNLETFNTSRIFRSIKNFDSVSRSGEVDFNMLIKNRLEEILKRDNVIIEGRSALMLLDEKDVKKIFLTTPVEDRIKHVADRRGISIESARDDVIKSDEERNNLVQRFFRKNAADTTNYDFSLDTSGKTYSKVADIIANVIKSI